MKWWKSIDKALAGGVTILFTFGLAAIWWAFPPNTLIPIWILTILLLASYAVCLIIYVHFKNLKSETIYVLPEVRAIKFVGEEIILILDKCELYLPQSLVSIFFTDSETDLESFTGLGYIETVNSQGYLQIKVIRQGLNNEIIKKIKKGGNQRYIRNSIKVKPNITKNDMVNILER